MLLCAIEMLTILLFDNILFSKWSLEKKKILHQNIKQLKKKLVWRRCYGICQWPKAIKTLNVGIFHLMELVYFFECGDKTVGEQWRAVIISGTNGSVFCMSVNLSNVKTCCFMDVALISLWRDQIIFFLIKGDVSNISSSLWRSFQLL